MKTLAELKILPKEGEWVTSVSANKSPVSNNHEINKINSNMGDIGFLRDTHYPNYDFKSSEKDILRETDNIVKDINIDKIDIGNKYSLNTKSKINLVNSLNEIDEALYTPSRLEDILARYSDNRRGDYIHSGMSLSFDTKTEITKEYFTYLYETTTENSSFYRWEWLEDTSKWSRVKYIKGLKKSKYSSIKDTSTEVSFSLTPGTAFVNGYKVSTNNTLTVTLPDTIETDPDIVVNSANLFLVGSQGSAGEELHDGNSYNIHIYDIYYSFQTVTEGQVVDDYYVDDEFFNDSYKQQGDKVTNYPSDIDTVTATNCYLEPPLEITITGTEESYVKEGNVHYIDLSVFINHFHGVNFDFTNMTYAEALGIKAPVPFDVQEYGTIYWPERWGFIYTEKYGNNWNFVEIVFHNGKYRIKIDEDHPIGNSIYDFSLGITYVMTIDDGNVIHIDSLSSHEISDFGMNLRKDNFSIIKSVEHFFVGFETIEFEDVLSTYPRLDLVFLESKRVNYLNEYGWKATEDYIHSEVTYFDEYIYMASKDITANATAPDEDPRWTVMYKVDGEEYFQENILRYIEGNTSISSDGNPVFNTPDYDGNGLLLASVYRRLGIDPIVVPNINSRLYDVTKIKQLETLSQQNEYNIARIKVIGDIGRSTSNEVTLTRDLYTDNFSDNFARDFLLERESGASPVEINNNVILPNIVWNGFDSTIGDNHIQLDSVGDEVLIEQLHYTGSDLINEYEVSTPSALFFEMVPNEHTFLYEEYIDVKSETTTTGDDVWGSRRGFRVAVSNKTRTEDTILNTKIVKLTQNGTRPINNTISRTISLPIYTFGSNEAVSLTIGSERVSTGVSKEDGSVVISFSLSGTQWRDTNYKVTMKGLVSGSEAISTLSIFAEKKTTEVDRKTVNYRYLYKYDPIAQTFESPEDCSLSSVEVIFNLESPSGNTFGENETFILPENVTLCISETTVGLPDHEKILYTQTVPIATEVNNTEFHKIVLDRSIPLIKEKVYAFFFLAPAKAHKKYISGQTFESYEGTRIMVRTAELDKHTPYTPVKLINEQPYIDGVMLKSSNAVTWTEFQNKDLAFKLNKAVYPIDTPLIVDAPALTITGDYTDMYFSYDSEVPDSCTIDSQVTLKDSSAAVIGVTNILPGEVIRFPVTNIKSSEFRFIAESSKSSLTPTINNSLTSHFGRVAEESVYITKNINFNYTGSLVTKDVRVLLDIFEDWDISKIKVYINTNGVITNDNWTEIISYVEGDVAGEIIWSLDSVQFFRNFRIKISLFTDETTTERIKMKNLRVMLNTGI